MDFLIAYDVWCMSRVESLLLWLEEWLSITQKQAERGMIIVYFISFYICPPSDNLGSISAQIVAGGAISMLMWNLHRRPAATRYGKKPIIYLSWVRIIFQAITFFLIWMWAIEKPVNFLHLRYSFVQIVYMIFYYAVDIHIDGKPGRRRKLALAELKKLFGECWIPKPLPTGR